MYELLWFVGGALLYKFLSKLLKVYQAFILFQETQIQTIAMLVAAAEDLKHAIDAKQKALEKTDLTEEELKDIKSTDASALMLWKEISVKKLIIHTPSYFKGLVQFQTWNECVNYFNSTIEKGYKTRH